MTNWIHRSTAAAIIGLLVAVFPAGAADRPPNFVVILADDLGYGDLACYGHPTIRTPHLDRLAAEGIRFTDCYAAAPICSPSRAGLMTGRTPTRAGIYTWIAAGSPMHLRRHETTIASMLKKTGYVTCHSGKWHLNGLFNQRAQPQPGDHGFDHWFSTQNNAGPTHENPVNFVRNGKKAGPQNGYSCQLVADEAIAWLKKQQPADKPFLLYACFHETHEKVASPPEIVAQYPGVPKKGEDIYYANVTNMDRAVGRLMDALDELKLAENTLVWFMSDHGPEITNLYPEAWRSHGTAGILRGKKRSLHDGGIRVPGILRWKGRVAPGQTVRTPVCSLDLFPTFCELAGAPLPKERTLDGTSLVPLLRGESLNRPKPLFWHFYAGTEGKPVALRDGDWKLVARIDQSSPVDDKLQANTFSILKQSRLIGFELYNLAEDVGEGRNVADREPEHLKRLSEMAQMMYQEVIAEAPDWFAESVPSP